MVTVRVVAAREVDCTLSATGAETAQHRGEVLEQQARNAGNFEAVVHRRRVWAHSHLNTDPKCLSEEVPRPWQAIGELQQKESQQRDKHQGRKRRRVRAVIGGADERGKQQLLGESHGADPKGAPP